VPERNAANSSVVAEREGLDAYFFLQPNFQTFLASRDAAGTDLGTFRGTAAKGKDLFIDRLPGAIPPGNQPPKSIAGRSGAVLPGGAVASPSVGAPCAAAATVRAMLTC